MIKKIKIENMKYSKLVLLALLLSVVVMATAQNNDPVVVKINKEEIKLSEFKNTFAKNNNLQTTTKADLFSSSSLMPAT